LTKTYTKHIRKLLFYADCETLFVTYLKQN